MNDLPHEILAITAGYLHPSDAIQLNNTCKKMHSKLSLTATAPHTIITEFSRRDGDGDGHYGFHIPVPDQVSCHSMHVSMIWEDQGWGQVFVVAEERNQACCGDGRSSRRFGDGRLVYNSATASHDEKRMDIEFQPKENETYHVWYVVAPGGEHSLSLSTVSIQALVFDDTSRCYGKAYSFLSRTQALPAWDKQWMAIIHLDVEQFLLSYGEQYLPPLISFADRGNDVSDADSEQKLMSVIHSIWKSWMDEYVAYAKIMAEARPFQQVFCQECLVLDAMQVDFGGCIVVEEGY